MQAVSQWRFESSPPRTRPSGREARRPTRHGVVAIGCTWLTTEESRQRPRPYQAGALPVLHPTASDRPAIVPAPHRQDTAQPLRTTRRVRQPTHLASIDAPRRARSCRTPRTIGASFHVERAMTTTTTTDDRPRLGPITLEQHEQNERMARIVDLFAGPGGWDHALHQLGRGADVVGIEWDDAACATRRARGLRTLQADIADLDPLEFAAIIDGLIASPPCQAWSMAGKRLGEQDRELVMQVAADLTRGVDRRAEAREEAADERSILAVEPLRWALALRPRWIACEQVPPVLGLWEAFAVALEAVGYSTWTGILRAEQYGVPQTRQRAFLIARRDGIPACPPPPTHRRYMPPRKVDAEAPSLFDEAPDETVDREAIVHPDDRDLLPWVSMADALGWSGAVATHMNHDGQPGQPVTRDAATPAPTLTGRADSWSTGRPSPTITGGGDATTASASSPRAATAHDGQPRSAQPSAIHHPQVSMRANAQRNSAVRRMDEPAPTIKGGHDHGDRQWIVDTGNTRSGARAEGRARPADEPAPVVTSRADQLEWRDDEPDTTPTLGPSGLVVEYRRGGERLTESTSCDAPAPTITTRTDRWQVKTSRDGGEQVRDASEPAPTVGGVRSQWTRERPAHTLTTTRRSDEGMLVGRQLADGEGRNVGGHGWTADRPATTVAGDNRVPQPGHKKNAAKPDSPGRMEGAVRVTEAEAAVLQGFPADYPWQGNKGKRFEQIGNAVPPPLAAAVLAPLLDVPDGWMP